MVEQRTVNPLVASSTLARGAILLGSTRGLGHNPFTVAAGVRIPYRVPIEVYMTTDKNFRLNRQVKGILALMKGTKEQKNHYKKMMIRAQIAAETAQRNALKGREQKD